MHVATPASEPHAHLPATLHRASLPFARRMDLRHGFALSRALSDRRVWVNSRLLAWVLLPDAWQGLVQAGALDSPALRLDRAREAGERAWMRSGGQGALWAFGGQLMPLTGTQAPRDAARDLVMAAVRAGLAGRMGDYPFWDAVWLDAPSIQPARVRPTGAT